MKYMIGLKNTDTALVECIKKNKENIYEVYFSWGDIPNGRTSQLESENYAPWEMQEMQRALQDQYKHKWEPICPETGQNKLLWMIGEIGEVIDIVKKNGAQKASSDETLRKDLIEEMSDVLMYYNDVMLCYGISVEELSKVYREKFERNMKRW